MTERSHAQRQRSQFNKLVIEGVYTPEFSHPAFLRQFFEDVVKEIVARKESSTTLTVLDCGCGPGAWLTATEQIVHSMARECSLHGFDISDRMIETAELRLAHCKSKVNVHRGDLLNPDSYRFPGIDSGFDLIFAFDAVQQLPRSAQWACIDLMTANIKPGGTLAIFDHDAASQYGRSMAMKKLITQYLHIPLVPRFYCNARYPQLAKFGRRLQDDGKFEATIIEASNSPKKALVAIRNR